MCPNHLNRAQEVVARSVQQIVRERRARRDGLDHRPPHDSLRELRIFDLLADRDAKSLLHQAPQVFAHRANRHARQRHLCGAAVVARRKCQSERARRSLRVFVEHLVEVAHPEKQNRVLVPRLDLPVLLHQRRRRIATHGFSASTTIAAIFASFSFATSSIASARRAYRPMRTRKGFSFVTRVS